MQKPIAAEKLFVPNFRPADKLVWNGNRFVVAPAGQLAYMTHPQTGRRMMVAEPTATNVVLYSSDFSISNWGGSIVSREPVAGIFPGKQGWLLTNNHESNPLVPIIQNVGLLTGQPQTAMFIFKKGSSDTVRVALRDATLSSMVVRATFDIVDGSLDIATEGGSGENISGGFIELGDDKFIVWITATATNPGNQCAVYFYPGFSDPGTNSTLYYVGVENTAYWTSPIVTGDTALTRAGDVLRIDDYDQKVIGNKITGTMFAEYIFPMGAPAPVVQQIMLMESENGSASNRAMIYYSASSPERVQLYLNATPGGIRTVAAPPITLPTYDSVRVAGTVADDALQLFVACNGVASGNTSPVTYPEGVNVLNIGGNTVVRDPLWITKITRDHIVRTAAELEALTS